MGRLSMSTPRLVVVLAVVWSCCVVNNMVAATTWGSAVSPAPEDKPHSQRRKLLLHIGPHKTGTTAFQSWVRINQGISPTVQYPKVCGGMELPSSWFAYLGRGLCTGSSAPKATAARGLPRKIRKAFNACPPTPETFIAALNDVASNPTDLVISTEAFALCSIDQFAMLKALFGQAVDIELVILRRESRSLMLSRYHQWHKMADHTESFTDAYIHGEDLAGWSFVCSYTSLECLRGLSDAFGASHVHLFSYEGLIAAGKELSVALCDVFSNSTGCYAEPSKDESRYKPNVSQSHEVYSAATILNHFKTITGCRFPGQGTNALGPHVLPEFMEALEKAGVRKPCYPLSHIPALECDSCFFDAILGEDESISEINRYYFHEGAAYLAASTPCEVCDYKESTIYESAETFNAIAKATRRLADSCTGYDGTQL